MKAFNDMVNVNTTAFDALMEKAWRVFFLEA